MEDESTIDISWVRKCRHVLIHLSQPQRHEMPLWLPIEGEGVTTGWHAPCRLRCLSCRICASREAEVRLPVEQVARERCNSV
jgi:hypothetical protein